jgi:hypothetical protein
LARADRDSNQRAATPSSSMLTITPSIRFTYFRMDHKQTTDTSQYYVE